MDKIISFGNYLWFKVIAVIPFCFFDFTQSQKNITFGIIFIVILDTVLGILVSLQHRNFKSSRLRQAMIKVGQYGLAMMSVWVLSAVEPDLFGWVFRYTGLFIIVTEILSNFEKLALLGFNLPTSLISKLNHDYKRLVGVKKTERKKIVKEMTNVRL